MKRIRPIACLLLFLLLAGTGFSQRKFTGKVIEIIDGKTVVVEMESGKLTAVLQFIETPEREQPLYWTVRDHLEKLVLGKSVEFHPQGLLPGKTFGQLYVGGLDIAQQMLRDGAAWHIGVSRSGQESQEAAAYQISQTQAKDEKRGVWSLVNLKPAWEFRAERDELRRQQERPMSVSKISSAQASGPGTVKTSANGSPKLWADRNPAMGNVGALLNGYNAEKKTGYISTPLLAVSGLQKEGEPKEQEAAAVEITYIYNENSRQGRTGVFVIGLVSYSKEAKFLKSNEMLMMADEKKFVIGKAKRTTFTDGDMLRERLTYQVKRSTVEAMSNGGDVSLIVGPYLLKPTHGLQLLLYNMLEASR